MHKVRRDLQADLTLYHKVNPEFRLSYTRVKHRGSMIMNEWLQGVTALYCCQRFNDVGI